MQFLAPFSRAACRSEGSVAMGAEMLRCAQHDNGGCDLVALDVLSYRALAGREGSLGW